MPDNIEYKSDYANEPQEGIDYQLSKEGYRIMTESFLKNRGYCCGNGCKNCPYFPKATKGNTNLR
ncbi:MAG: DUF5522 domain-containing protein [Mariniphaga sp.]